ncbi:MAG TPA: DUF1385 domain-containing protein [Candidatus Onthomonas avicola]|nr:DUF1385 domain-containing protein [Candidatus Onthomonas avicola]
MQTNRQKSAFRTTIGGQALIEGILMRGPEKQAIVVRRPDGGLEVRVEELQLIKERYPVLGWPFIRGVVTFLDSMIRGVKALMFSADFYPEEEAAQPSKFELWLEEKLGSEKFSQIIVGLAVVLGVGFSIGLFFLLPAALTGLLQIWVPMSRLAVSAVEGVIRVLLFLAYLIFCSRLSDIRRVFSYHGAEHKTIFCYERGLDLTVENVSKMPRHHPRCGTSFLFVVIIVAILVHAMLFSVVTPPNLLARMALQLLTLPVIVGISYEFNRFAGRHDNLLTRVLTAPGLWMQNFTTFEPDASMMEVAIEALRLVLPSRVGQDRW